MAMRKIIQLRLVQLPQKEHDTLPPEVLQLTLEVVAALLVQIQADDDEREGAAERAREMEHEPCS
jgi:hypothetical protein